MVKKLIVSLAILILVVGICSIDIYALDPVTAMQDLKGEDLKDETGKLGDLINTAIAVIQVAGTGISIIMVSMLGIKYIMAAPSDKADVKKQIAPLCVGAVILFASVNIVGIISKTADTTMKEAAG